MYEFAAAAAGVGMLALAPRSEAKIVYTPAHVVIGRDQTYGIDLRHDGGSDVVIQQSCDISFIADCWLWAEPSQGNGVEEGTQGHGWAAALNAGANIGYPKQFNHGSRPLMAFYNFRKKSHAGYWNYAQSHYLGVAFQINGKTHFGWARFKNSSYYGATLTGYAYETVPGKSIKAGQTKVPGGRVG
jgi:hypothetical protein